MKIKNLKINQNSASRLIACSLVGSLLATALSGCGNSAIFDGTILENTCVITFADGTKDIAEVYEACSMSKGPHYYSIISGMHYASIDCDKKAIYHYEIVKEEPLNSYLTTDELAKATNYTLSEDDIGNIISRIVGPTPEKVNTK